MLKVYPFEKRDPERKDVVFADVEYKYMDFYGPYVNFEIERNNKLLEIMATPVSLVIETAEVTMSDYDILVKASEELYDLFGEFYLKTGYFIAKIDSRDIEAILYNEMKKIKLF